MKPETRVKFNSCMIMINLFTIFVSKHPTMILAMLILSCIQICLIISALKEIDIKKESSKGKKTKDSDNKSESKKNKFFVKKL